MDGDNYVTVDCGYTLFESKGYSLKLKSEDNKINLEIYFMDLCSSVLFML